MESVKATMYDSFYNTFQTHPAQKQQTLSSSHVDRFPILDTSEIHHKHTCRFTCTLMSDCASRRSKLLSVDAVVSEHGVDDLTAGTSNVSRYQPIY